MSVVASDTALEQALFHHVTPHQGFDAPNGSTKSNGVKFSLNDLRLGESFDTIKLDVGLLAWHIGHFPIENGAVGERVTEDDLYAILELSQNIGNNIDKIIALRNQNGISTDTESLRNDSLASGESYHENHPHHALKTVCSRRKNRTELPSRNSSKRPRSITCRACATDHTPKWRNGPAGPGTLCNVCGLVYAKRRGRVQSTKEMAKQPSSC